jgi:hypothetical protein
MTAIPRPRPPGGGAGRSGRGAVLRAAGAATPGARFLPEPADFGLRHDVEATDALAAHLAGVDELSEPLGAIARLAGCLGDQDQLLVLHEADYIAPRQYPTTLALLAATNYNIGVGQ